MNNNIWDIQFGLADLQSMSTREVFRALNLEMLASMPTIPNPNITVTWADLAEERRNQQIPKDTKPERW